MSIQLDYLILEIHWLLKKLINMKICFVDKHVLEYMKNVNMLAK